MASKTESLLGEIYGSVPETLIRGIDRLMQSAKPAAAARLPTPSLWSHEDVVLITYADQIRSGTEHPLRSLRSFLLDNELDQLLRTVHLLPFFPYSSDDGFSVIDFLEVDPEVGDWLDVAQLGESFDLMFDLVLNHCSVKHRWFQRFLDGDPKYQNFFITQDPDADLSAVVRPRSLPLLTPFETASGIKYVWTTFSADQVDLNYADPAVLMAMLETLIQYARRGARIIRLDAIAFLWKTVGTPCIHLSETHAVVRLMRHVISTVAPRTLLLTETNVPHAENLSYFGSGEDEAHMVYQFSLPPLLLDAIHSGDAGVLRRWLSTLKPPSASTSFFNFTASHDGIGVRPLEGLVPDQRIAALCDVVRRHGGKVNTRRMPDGSDTAYELNVTYLDAVADRSTVPAAEHARRFLATQAIMLSMQGVPAIYFHSLVGTASDLQAAERSSENRRINRRKFQRDELDALLAKPHSLERRVFDGYRKLLELRKGIRVFHPSASQTVIDLDHAGLLGFVRQHESGDCVAVLASLTSEPVAIDPTLVDPSLRFDLLADEQLGPNEPITMRPFQVRWLSREPLA